MRVKIKLLYHRFSTWSTLTSSVCVVLGRARWFFFIEGCADRTKKIAPVSVSRNSQKRNELGGMDKKPGESLLAGADSCIGQKLSTMGLRKPKHWCKVSDGKGRSIMCTRRCI